jgi:hypothetical protein
MPTKIVPFKVETMRITRVSGGRYVYCGTDMGKGPFSGLFHENFTKNEYYVLAHN